jgi:hypothetical protein
MEYQTFRWRIHANTPTDIDTVLNALPAGTFVEGYATAGDELFINRLYCLRKGESWRWRRSRSISSRNMTLRPTKA